MSFEISKNEFMNRDSMFLHIYYYITVLLETTCDGYILTLRVHAIAEYLACTFETSCVPIVYSSEYYRMTLKTKTVCPYIASIYQIY